MKIYIPLILSTILLLAGCSPTGGSGTPELQSENPGWVDELIRKFESEPVGNPPQSIWRHEYKGQIVYYVPAQCCDMFSSLYDADGNVICAPDGGITGTGDGRCADFSSHKTGGKLIWKDPRPR